MWLSFLWVKQQWWPQLLSSPVNPAPVPGISRLKYSGGALRLRLNRKVLTALWQPKRDSHIIILLFVVLPWVLLKWTSPNQNPLAFQRSSSTSRWWSIRRFLAWKKKSTRSLCFYFPFAQMYPSAFHLLIAGPLLCALWLLSLLASIGTVGRLTTRTLVNRTSDDETPSSYQHASHSSPQDEKECLM